MLLLIHEIIFVFLLSLDQALQLVHGVIFVFGSVFVLSLDRVVLSSMLLFLSLALSLDQVLLVLDVKLIFKTKAIKMSSYQMFSYQRDGCTGRETNFNGRLR